MSGVVAQYVRLQPRYSKMNTWLSSKTERRDVWFYNITYSDLGTILCKLTARSGDVEVAADAYGNSMEQAFDNALEKLLATFKVKP